MKASKLENSYDAFKCKRHAYSHAILSRYFHSRRDFCCTLGKKLLPLNPQSTNPLTAAHCTISNNLFFVPTFYPLISLQ